MNKRSWLILAFLISVSLLGSLLLTAVQFAAFDINNYSKAFDSYNLGSTTRLTKPEYLRISRNLLEYLKGGTDTIYNSMIADGREKVLFNTKELRHMEDVRSLFRTGYTVRNLSFLLLVVSAVFMVITDKGRKKNLGKAFFFSSVTMLVILIPLLLLINTDFYNYFTIFHEVLFTNDMWLLDPDTDLLINMYPLEFFGAMAARIFMYFAAQLLAVGAMGYFIFKMNK